MTIARLNCACKRTDCMFAKMKWMQLGGSLMFHINNAQQNKYLKQLQPNLKLLFCVLSWNSVQSTPMTLQQFPLREPIWHYHVSWWKRPSRTAQIIPKDTHPSIYLPSEWTRCAYKHPCLTFCPFSGVSSCVILYFLSPNISEKACCFSVA